MPETVHSQMRRPHCWKDASFPRRGSQKPFISCIIPAFNEAHNLPELLTELTITLQKTTGRYEVIVVDDGSTDETAQSLAPWLSSHGVRHMVLSRNFGKEAALTAGLDHARGDLAILMDADLQHPPALLIPMLAAWREGADMVCAIRNTRDDENWLKRTGSRLFYSVVNLGSSVKIPPGAGDFRLLDRRVIEALKSLPERNRFMKGLYAWVGFRTAVIPYQPAPRRAGTSSFSASRLARLALTGLTSFTNLPLQVWSAGGAAISLGALITGIWLFCGYLFQEKSVSGWSIFAVGSFFLGGVQLLSIGVLGEYIGRIFEEVKGRPLYLVAKEAGQACNEPERSAPSSSEIFAPIFRRQGRMILSKQHRR